MLNTTEKTSKNKLRLPLRAYLSYILLATLLFTGVSFSKFATTSSGQDSARVAVMASDTSFVLNDINLAPGDAYVDIPVTLTNQKDGRVCEVEQQYTMYVENITNNMELTFTYYNDKGVLIKDGDTPVSEVVGFFHAAAVDTDTYTIRVEWTGPRTEEYSHAVDALRVRIVAEQLDEGVQP